MTNEFGFFPLVYCVCCRCAYREVSKPSVVVCFVVLKNFVVMQVLILDAPGTNFFTSTMWVSTPFFTDDVVRHNSEMTRKHDNHAVGFTSLSTNKILLLVSWKHDWLWIFILRNNYCVFFGLRIDRSGTENCYVLTVKRTVNRSKPRPKPSFNQDDLRKCPRTPGA